MDDEKFERLYKELEERLGVNPLDYFSEHYDYLQNNKELMLFYFRMIYSIGFNDGDKYQRGKHGNGLEIPVIRMDEKGNELERYKSVQEATRAMGCKSKSSIFYAMKHNQRCYGYYWKREE